MITAFYPGGCGTGPRRAIALSAAIRLAPISSLGCATLRA